MKTFYRLLNYEFGALLRAALLLSVGTVLSTLLLLSARMNHLISGFERYENIYVSSGSMLVFWIYTAAFLAYFLKTFYSGYWGGKSVYTLLTLPVRREALYFSKLGALAIGLLLLWAALALSVWLGYGLVESKAAESTGGQGGMRGGLFLALIRSGFFQFALPLNLKGLISTLSIGAVAATGLYYAVLCERARCYWGALPLATAVLVVIRVAAYRASLPETFVTGFSVHAASAVLVALACWFTWHGIRLLKRGAIA